MDIFSLLGPVFRAIGAFLLEGLVYVVMNLLFEGVCWLFSRLGRVLRAGWECASRLGRSA